ncbi:hypothetical protein EYF80_060754 [Liparis tanakae]|uniref:Uncharacterized protein n=1 Tax=Liparis tanakae TaxID=230148 RepID=A0A4Z2EJW4_9TELE|nr:hypothetical protein EYF80_060754 [Liparis tanakae]
MKSNTRLRLSSPGLKGSPVNARLRSSPGSVVLLNAEPEGGDAVEQPEGLDHEPPVLKEEVGVAGGVQDHGPARLLLWVRRAARRGHLRDAGHGEDDALPDELPNAGEVNMSDGKACLSNRSEVVPPTCIREEQLGPHLHTAQLLLLRVGVEAHGAEQAGQAEQVVPVQVRDEHLGDPT